MYMILSKKVLLFLIFLSVIILLFYTTKKDVKFHEQLLRNENTLTLNETVTNNTEQIVTEIGEPTNENTQNTSKTKESPMKYILQWTSPKNVPFVYMGVGQKTFLDKNCPYQNCYVTSDRNYLGDYTKFDVIAFAGPEVIRMGHDLLPKNRGPHQKYTFASIESAANYPVCSNRFNNYFNWTWTFRLDSQVRWGYMTIRDKNKNVIGPKKIMHWMKLEEMEPVSETFKAELKTKSIAAAWFVSNCYTKSRREKYVQELQEELKKYNLKVDIYGNCGHLRCSRDNEDACHKLIKEKYYFYLSFENSFDEDYVTEKLLHALKYNAIPIVYGAANYTRFMPDGIYINAKELDVKELAIKMNKLIQSPDKYATYFKWKNHYSYHRQLETPETDEYCMFCTILNDQEMLKKRTIYENFRQWWDPPGRC